MRYSTLLLICLAACLLVGNASAETRIVAPGGSLEDTADLPLIISGVTAATGVGFELFYDPDVVHIESITASSEVPGSNVVPGIYNDAGFAKVAVTSTEGISAPEPVPLVIIRFTRVGPGESSVTLQEPQWSDAQFMSFDFDAAEGGIITSPETATPATPTPSSGSQSTSSSSGAPAATPTPERTKTPAVTTAIPGATTMPPTSPAGTVETLPTASPGMTPGSTQPPRTPEAAPGFGAATVFAAGVVGVALLMYRRS
ncbi:cohesin domain-containing protein [Methanoculleus sp.]|uniref:cohesin domain-containing protein n=1 Tax=Methanoculleus sp. TaxID=90427 RepID=UPI002FCC59C1